MAFTSIDWSTDGFYHPKTSYKDKDYMGYGLRAIKIELAYNGFSDPLMADNDQYGSNTAKNVKAFQESVGLTPDGVIGPRTMKALSRKRVLAFEEKYSIPEHYLCRQLDLESAFCPYCLNIADSGQDKGIAQIHFEGNDPSKARFPMDNSPVCPGGEWSFAFRIGVNVKFLAQYQHQKYKHFNELYPDMSEDDKWKCVLFSYNAPAWADEWAEAGLPETGGKDLSPEFAEYSGCKTRFEWATLYTRVLLTRSC